MIPPENPENPDDRGMEMLGCLLVLGCAAVMILIIVNLVKIWV